MAILVTVIIPTLNEEGYISGVLDNVLDQTYPNEALEILVIDGRSSDNTRAVVELYVAKYNNIRLLDNPEGIVPYALNYGIEHASGEVIVRLDAHSRYPNDYLEVLVDKLEETGADNVGGMWQVCPANNTRIAKAIAYANSSRFGIGSPAYRFEGDGVREVDTMPFGCYRRDVFDRVGKFDTDLVRNQDDEFNSRLLSRGGKIMYVPQVKVQYFARDTIYKMAKMFYQYGLYKPLASKKLGRVSTLRQIVPPLFVFTLVFLASLMFIDSSIGFALVVLMLVYVVIAIYEAFLVAKEEKGGLFLLLIPFIYFVIHVSYGAGYIRGLVNTFLPGFGYSKDKVSISR